MPDQPQPGAATSGRRPAGREVGPRVAIVLTVLALFVSYPLALFIPVRAGVPLLFHVTLPTPLWWALASLAFLLVTPWQTMSGGGPTVPGSVGAHEHVRLAGVAYGLFLLAVGGCVASAWLGDTPHWRLTVVAIGLFSVPLFFATCPRAWLPRRLEWVLAALAAVQTVHGLWQLAVHFEVVGLAGNRNWMAALLAALLPWPWLALVPQAGLARTGWRPHAWRIGLAAAASVASLGLLVKAESRAAWLILAGYGAWMGLRACRRPSVRWLTALALAGGLAAAAWLGRDALRRVDAEDIRLPLWRATARLVADHPLLGVGPGNYRREFARYRGPEQLARRNAAPVTEHPHNEGLHVAAQLGVPLALFWALLLVPLAAVPRSGGFWRAVHFSAVVLAGTALFDKEWVQAPTCLLGPMLVGLLWRRHLPFRSRPQARPPLLRRLAVPVAVAAALAAGVESVRELRTGWHFRGAYHAETQGRYPEAYEHYRQSTGIDPRNVLTHAYAGICANNKLRDPQVALPHLVEAATLEPDFAHVNGEIGLALGAQGLDAAALPYFRRDTELFPYHTVGLERYYVCALAVPAAVVEARSARERLTTVRRFVLIQRRGEAELARLGRDWAAACQAGDPSGWVKTAEDLVSLSSTTMAEPALSRTWAAAGGRPGEGSRQRFTVADAERGRRLWHWRQLALAAPGASVDQLLKLWHEDQARPPAEPDGTAARECGDRWFAEFLQQAGLEAALLTTLDGTSLGVLEVWDGRDPYPWVCSPSRRLAFNGLSADTLWRDDEVRSLFGLPEVRPPGLRLALPCQPEEFLLRTQALGDLVKAALGRAAPRLGDSPSLRRQDWLYLRGGTEAEDDGAGPDTVRPLPVEFDTWAFRGQTSAPAAPPRPGDPR